MRVIGGELRGRKLQAPAGGVRPTADRVREALFQRLGDFSGARVLDLYAGTGALGIEALSRGAARAIFVEHGARAIAVLRANLAQLGLSGRARVIHADAIAALRSLARAGERVDLAFADPPYASLELARAFAVIGEAGIVVPGGMLVAETRLRVELPDAPGFTELDRRRYGDTVIVRLVAEGGPAIAAEAQESE
jgi:16S rRNA (guanine966-N2)-methyltransferase